MNRRNILHFTISVFVLLALSLALPLAAEEMYPPLPAAAKAINFDSRGFLIHGERTWLTSGSLHYARVPRNLWRDRLLRMKRAGLNTVQTYVFWNYHEEREGEFNFTGEHDLGAFLDLVHEMGMYATVRVGPYDCAEWEAGGYPVWLRNKPGLKVRLNNPVFLKAVDSFFDHLLPIVAARQIHRGGAVIMVQLENEYYLGKWGVDDSNLYLQHLLKTARTNGIEVPTFFSGQNHDGNPMAKFPENDATRKSPWYSTEFWTSWYTGYGELNLRDNNPWARTIDYFDRGTWRILANGGNGYNYYMFHGGTNLGMWNDDQSAASYDFQTEIGEAGDLRQLYYSLRRPAIFAHSFQSILEDSDNANAEYKSLTADVPVTARKSPAGTAIFLDNATHYPKDVTLADGAKLLLDADEFVGLVRDARLNNIFTLSSDARIFAVVPQGKLTTVIAYGMPGENVALSLQASALTGDSAWKFEKQNSRATLSATVKDGDPQSFIVSSGDQLLRVLVMTKALTDETWIADSGNKNYIVIGPHYLGEFQVDGSQVRMTVEEPIGVDPIPTPIALWSESTKPLLMKEPTAKDLPDAPTTDEWVTLPIIAEAAPEFDDSKWFKSVVPAQMGADNDPSVFAWYRAHFYATEAGRMWLQLGEVSDHGQIWVNGKRLLTSTNDSKLIATNEDLPWAVPVEVKAGDNVLAIFVSHKGRNKLFSYSGPISILDRKGVIGPTTLNPTLLPLIPVENWKWDIPKKWDDQSKGAKELWNSANSQYSLKNDRDQPDTTHEGVVHYRVTLPKLDATDRVLHIGYLYGHAVIALNGHELKTVDGTGGTLDLPLDAAVWKDTSELTVALEKNPDIQMMGRIYLTAGTPQITISDWRLHGGVGTPKETATDEYDSARLFRSHFEWKPAAELTPILRFSTKGLSRGFIWINGHNVGRYPQTIPVDGLYLPECWLKPGKNDLEVLDESGLQPGNDALIFEQVASRASVELKGVLK